MSAKTAWLLAIVPLSLADGAAGQYFYPGQPLPPSRFWFALAFLTVVFAWYTIDSDQRDYKRSMLLNLAIVALGIVAVPYYLFRTRGAKNGFIATGLFVLVLIGSGVLTTLGARAIYALQLLLR